MSPVVLRCPVGPMTKDKSATIERRGSESEALSLHAGFTVRVISRWGALFHWFGAASKSWTSGNKQSFSDAPHLKQSYFIIHSNC
ncbi:hypothetical protein SUGI_0394130 [Cryptomeria japonica]|nr:hypothetical protein SUGI_0394130 [Cryptomeria japonica]